MNKTERREVIIDCAKELFLQKGYHSTTVTDVIEKARIARSTFYAHFTSKNDIFFLLVDRFAAILRDAILGINISRAEKGNELTGQIRGMTVGLVEAFDANRDLTQLLITAPQGIDNLFDEKIEEFYATILRAIRQLLEEGIREGNIKPLNPSIIAYCILGSTKQILLQWILYREIEDIYAELNDIIQYHLFGISS